MLLANDILPPLPISVDVHSIDGLTPWDNKPHAQELQQANDDLQRVLDSIPEEVLQQAALDPTGNGLVHLQATLESDFDQSGSREITHIQLQKKYPIPPYFELFVTYTTEHQEKYYDMSSTFLMDIRPKQTPPPNEELAT